MRLIPHDAIRKRLAEEEAKALASLREKYPLFGRRGEGAAPGEMPLASAVPRRGGGARSEKQATAAVASPTVPPTGASRIPRLGELADNGDLRGLSIKSGGSKGLVWTLKGYMDDGSPGYLHGESSTIAGCLVAAEYCLSKGDWRRDRF